MNTTRKIFYLFFLVCILLPASSFSQKWILKVDGHVLANDVKLSGSIITLFKNGVQDTQLITEADGAFMLRLPANAEFLLTVTKPGYITKKISILTTNVPPGKADTNRFVPFFPNIHLFLMPIDPESSKRMEALLSQPLAIYKYIPNEKRFDYDLKYTEMVKSRLAALEEMQLQAENAMQEKAKAGAVEAQKQLDLDNDYKAELEKGDKALSRKEYSAARAAYKDALVLKPAETYPLKKIEEVDKLIAKGGKK